MSHSKYAIMLKSIKEKYETLITKKTPVTFQVALFEKAHRSKAGISGACKAAPASQLPAVAFCRQSGVKQQEQWVSQLLCSVVQTAVRLSRIIWPVLLLQQSWRTQLNRVFATGRGLGEPALKAVSTWMQKMKTGAAECAQSTAGHCEAEIEGRDYTKGKKWFHAFQGGEAERLQLHPRPDTHKHWVAVNSQPLLGCWRDPLQESQAPLPPDMPYKVASSITLAF